MNPLLKLGDLEEAEDVVQDAPNSYLMCVYETRDKQTKELIVGVVVRSKLRMFLKSPMQYSTSPVSLLEHCTCIF